MAIFLVIAVGLTHAEETGSRSHPAPPLPATEAVSLFGVLRALSSGATSMTGVEAASNAVPVFRPMEWRNAITTL